MVHKYVQKRGGLQNAVNKRLNRIFNKFAGKVALIKTRMIRFLVIPKAPKITQVFLFLCSCRIEMIFRQREMANNIMLP